MLLVRGKIPLNENTRLMGQSSITGPRRSALGRGRKTDKYSPGALHHFSIFYSSVKGLTYFQCKSHDCLYRIRTHRHLRVHSAFSCTIMIIALSLSHFGAGIMIILPGPRHLYHQLQCAKENMREFSVHFPIFN